jgi:hypothetical protein
MKKFFSYNDYQDLDSPKRKYKKRLKDRKNSSLKKSKMNGDYSDEDEFNKYSIAWLV